MLFVFFRIAAITATLVSLISRGGCIVEGGNCKAANFFSYFTIHSNILMLVALCAATYVLLFARGEPHWLTALRALATAYMLVSGITFGVLLYNASFLGHLFLVPWSSKVLHFVLPGYALFDFIFGPGRHKVHWKVLWFSIAYPVLWAMITTVRGQLAGWYPYFFLDPEVVGGYRVVSIYAAALGGFIFLIAAIVVAASRLPVAPPPDG